MKKMYIIVLLVLVFVFSACQQVASEEQVQTAIAETEAAKPTETNVPPTETTVPTATAVPTQALPEIKGSNADQWITCSSNGPGTCEVPDWATFDNLAVVMIEYSGEGNFVVSSVYDDGAYKSSLVDWSGEYTGTQPLSWFLSEGPTSIEVEEGSGEWWITFTTLGKIVSNVVMFPGQTYKGTGHTVRIADSSKVTFITLSCDVGDFSVMAFDKNLNGTQIIDEVAPFSIQQLVGDNYLYIIECGGEWKIETR